MISDIPERGELKNDIRNRIVLSDTDEEISQFYTSNKIVERMRNLFGTDDEESDSVEDEDDRDKDEQEAVPLPISATAPSLSPELPPVAVNPPYNREASHNGSAARNEDEPVPPLRTDFQSRPRNHLTAHAEGGKKTSKKNPLGVLDANIVQPSNKIKHILLPATPHGRARRIIANKRDVWSTVTMGGDVQFINRKRK
jgi:hypothetical protein